MNGLSVVQEPRLPLRDHLHLVVRIVWMVLAVLTLTVFVASVPAFLDHRSETITEAERAALAHIGLSVRSQAVYDVALDSLIALVFFFTAVAIFWRRSDDRMATLVATALLTLGVAISPTLDALTVRHLTWRLPVLVVQDIGFGLILFVFYLFPDGRFVPRWTSVLAVIWVVWGLAWFLFPTAPLDPATLPLPLRLLVFLLSPNTDVFSTVQRYLRLSSFLLMLMGWFSSGVFALIYRYTHVSSPVQRQQTKWVVFGLTASVVGFFGFQLVPSIIPALRQPGLPNTLYFLIGKPIYVLLMLLAPLSIMTSVLRYRLWDIDPIIQRTLVYGTLTGALAIVYFGSVFVFQRIFRTLTGQQSDVAVIVSTLAISALFQPLRRRLQNLIDRGFYREKVDFRHAFTVFSREIRTVIELPELLQVLINRTTDLLHIAHSAVFLRNPDGTFQQAEARNLPPGEGTELSMKPSVLGPLWRGHAYPSPEEKRSRYSCH